MIRAGLAFLLLALAAPTQGAAPQAPPADLTPERVGEALALAADETAARKFLDGYNLQSRAGWGKGPLIGRFSTPFSRVVQAALAARTRGRTLTAADVPPELLVPELHVIAISQRAENLEAMSRVRTVAVSARSRINAPGGGARIGPARIVELTADYQARQGTDLGGTGLVAIFPLRAVPVEAEIRVIFDQPVRGSSPSATCTECIVPLDLNKTR